MSTIFFKQSFTMWLTKINYCTKVSAPKARIFSLKTFCTQRSSLDHMQ